MAGAKDLQVLSIATTVGSLDAARRLARRLLDGKLAACVQLDQPLTSLYRWKGQLCDEPEVRLVIKTLPACAAAVQVFFAREHPYELPQFLATTMSASPAYAAWVRSEVVVPPPAAAAV